MAIKYEDLKGTNRSEAAIAGLEAMGSGIKIEKPTDQLKDKFKKSFYREGEKILESGTGRHIGATEWGREWTGRATEVHAPAQRKETAITADGLGREEDITLPDTGGEVDVSGEIIGGAKETTKTLQERIDALAIDQSESKEEREGIKDKMLELIGEQGGKAIDQLGAEKARNIPQLRTDYAELNTQIKTRLAEYELLKVDIEGKPIPMRSIIGQQAQVEKRKLAEIGLLQARASGLAGEIDTAQAQADRAIDLKYSTIDTTLKIYQAQLNMLEDVIDEEDRVTLMAQQQMLNEQQQALAEKKADEKEVQNVALQAMQNGADSALVSQIQNASSVIQANQIAGDLITGGGWSYVATPLERDQLIAQGYEITQSGGRTYAKKPDATVLAYAKQVRAGKMKIENVPATIRNKVVAELGELPITPSTPTPTPSTKLTPEEKKFKTELEAERKKLARGKSWGESWNYLHNRYPEASNEQLDAMLDKDKYFKQQ